MPKPTSLPWRVVVTHSMDHEDTFGIGDRKDVYPNIARGLTEANADFIVAACNAYHDVHTAVSGKNLGTITGRMDHTKRKDIVQVKNPRTKRYVKIDRDAGKIVSSKKSSGPYKNIPVAEQEK